MQPMAAVNKDGICQISPTDKLYDDQGETMRGNGGNVGMMTSVNPEQWKARIREKQCLAKRSVAPGQEQIYV